MRRVCVRIIVDLMQDPPSRIVDMLAHVESPAPTILGDGFAGVMKECLFKLRPHFRTDGHEDEDDVRGPDGIW